LEINWDDILDIQFTQKGDNVDVIFITKRTPEFIEKLKELNLTSFLGKQPTIGELLGFASKSGQRPVKEFAFASTHHIEAFERIAQLKEQLQDRIFNLQYMQLQLENKTEEIEDLKLKIKELNLILSDEGGYKNDNPVLQIFENKKQEKQMSEYELQSKVLTEQIESQSTEMEDYRKKTQNLKPNFKNERMLLKRN
jgi:hypothetical protein